MQLSSKCISSYPGLFKEVFDTSLTMRAFTDNVVRLSLQATANDGDVNKFRGDCMEVLAEALFLMHPADSRFGLKTYKPVRLEEDFGVDGLGINANGDKTAVQVKFRSNESEVVTLKEIGHMYLAGINLGVAPLKERNFILVTNAVGVSRPCVGQFGPRLVVIGMDVLKTLVDNNITFWGTLKSMVDEKVASYPKRGEWES